MASRREINESDDDDEVEPSEDEEQEEQEEEPPRRRGSGRALGRGRTRTQRFKAWFRDVRRDVYVLFFVGSMVLLVLGIAGQFAPNMLGSQMAAWFASIGGARPALFIGTLILFGIAGYLFGGLMGKRRQFIHLVSTRAKSEFVRNLDQIERLAFELGTKESDIVAAKKREYKIRH